MALILEALDHIHLDVPDKNDAADWYRDKLGFQVIESLKTWDTGNGPLTIGRGDLHLALFASNPHEPLHAIAFRCSGDAFMEWEAWLIDCGILDRCVDHDLAWSLYFSDPWGHTHEITSYDHSYIKAQKTGSARTDSVTFD